MDEAKINNLIKKGIEDYMNQKQYTLSKLASHRHDGLDTPPVSAVDLPIGSPLKIGLGRMISNINSINTATELVQTSIECGKAMGGKPLDTTTDNLQFNLLHYPQSAANQSFITAFRPPAYINKNDVPTTVTMGQSTITIPGYNFATNSLAGAIINIFDSSRTFVESAIIASNTSTVVTITGTWGSTITNGYYQIAQPVYLGSADTPWQRSYVMEDTTGGLRFGIGATANGQNGLLYMNATGDLYWRNKSGTSTKLN